MEKIVLQVDRVEKSIGRREIIKGISFQIEAGEVFGFLGPNGAGKSTTLRMIAGLSRPGAGQIMICGHSLKKAPLAALARMGCMIENPDLYEYLTGYKNLEMLAEMSGLADPRAIWAAVETVGLEYRIHDRVAAYSLGMKQRLGLAQALIHRPNLLVLDEPMNGLDPQGIHMFKTLVRDLAAREQVAVLVSSHLIAEVEQFCDRVAIIREGRILRDAPVDRLFPAGEVAWLLGDPEGGRRFLAEGYGLSAAIEGGRLVAVVQPDRLAEINAGLAAAGYKLHGVCPVHRSLETLFLDLTEDGGIH